MHRSSFDLLGAATNDPAPPFVWPIFVLGCVGALAPEIVRLYNLRHDTGFNWRSFYVIISVFFMFLGGVIAWILPATTYWGAFYVGVSAPVIISNIGKTKKSKSRKAAAPLPKESLQMKTSEPSLLEKSKLAKGQAGGAVGPPFSHTLMASFKDVRSDFLNAL